MASYGWSKNTMNADPSTKNPAASSRNAPVNESPKCEKSCDQSFWHFLFMYCLFYIKPIDHEK